MAVNRITGNILADNLQRGANLTIQGNLAYFDVLHNRVGILNSTPQSTLDVGGNLQVGNVIIALNGNISAGNVNINNLADPVVSSDAATKFYVDNVAANSNIGNFSFTNDTISLTTSPANITITPTSNSLAIINTNSGFVVPVGNTAQRPGTATAGTIRYNNSDSSLEFYNGIGWSTLGTSGGISITNQTINPDGTNASYTLNQTATSASILVSINGVAQTPDVDYTVSSSTITFTTTPIITDTIQIRFLAGVTSTNFLTNASGNAEVLVDSTGNVILIASSGKSVNITGALSATGNVSGSYILGNGSQLTGIVSSYGNSNVASYLTTYLGNISAGNVSATGNITAGNVVTTGALQGGSGTQGIALQPWTGGGSYAALYSTAITPGNGNYSILVNGTSTWLNAASNGSLFFRINNNSSPTAFTISSAQATVGSIGTANASAVSTQTLVVAGGGLGVTGNSYFSSSLGIGGNLSVGTGTVSLGNIVNNNGNGVGNIGSSSGYFNTVFATATTALYADLAENFLSDSNYPAGTVLIFGGDYQVTACVSYADSRAAGIVSTDPAYLMNAGVEGTSVPLALAGQVPCLVIGPISKGDILTTSDTEGYACRLNSKDWQPGVTIGKALENCGPGPHKINVLAISN